MIYRSYNEYHLGDNLLHLHFLRRLAQNHPEHEFIHLVHECHLPQLLEVINDLPNLLLGGLAGVVKTPSWRNVWKNAGGFWETHPSRADFAGFHLDWFRVLAAEMGLPAPFMWPEQLLFDYPALRTGQAKPFDFLIVNSRPCSGQLQGYDSIWYFEPLIADLKDKGYQIICTDPTHVPGVYCTRDLNLTLTGIGHLSQFCRHHIMVATGPMWPTFNIFGLETVQTRIILLDHILGDEIVNYAPHSIQVRNLAGARAVLKEKGLL